MKHMILGGAIGAVAGVGFSFLIKEDATTSEDKKSNFKGANLSSSSPCTTTITERDGMGNIVDQYTKPRKPCTSATA